MTIYNAGIRLVAVGILAVMLKQQDNGKSKHDSQAQLQEMDEIEVSTTLISNISDAVINEVEQWQNLLLHEVYPIVFLNRLVIKAQNYGQAVNNM